MLKIGSHISFKQPEYLVGAANESIANNANAMMIYLGAPQSAARIPTSSYLIEEYNKNYSAIIKPEDIVIHAPYIVNPASSTKSKFAIDFLIAEINRMNSFGAKYIVVHPGAYTDSSQQEAINVLIGSLKEIISSTKDVVILLETMSGKGTEIGRDFSELKQIIDGVNSCRLAICLDTCHVWESGINIKDYSLLINELNKYSLLDLIKVIHVNDSKNEMGAHKDRHENIGRGFIGLDALKKIVHGKEFENTIKILETPYVDDKPIYKEEIEMLR